MRSLSVDFAGVLGDEVAECFKPDTIAMLSIAEPSDVEVATEARGCNNQWRCLLARQQFKVDLGRCRPNSDELKSFKKFARTLLIGGFEYEHH